MGKKVNELVVTMFNCENDNERLFDVEEFALVLETVFGKSDSIAALESWHATKMVFFESHGFEGTALVLDQLEKAIATIEKYC